MKTKAFILSVVLAILPVVCFSACESAVVNRTRYVIDVALDGNVLSGSEMVEFYNDGDNVIERLKFNLYANAFRQGAKYSPISAQYLSKAYPNGVDYGNINIESVTCDGQDLSFSVGGQDMNVLDVELLSQVFPDEKVAVKIDFTINLANVIARTGYNDKTINLANFYPILCVYDGGFYECVYYANGDPFFSDCADYKVSITCDKDYVVASSGSLTNAQVFDQVVKATYQIENARSFAFVLSKNFQTITDNTQGVEINYYYYDDVNPLNSMEYAKNALNLFGELFGKYPYKTYSVVQTQFVQGGMEFPALVMISDQLNDRAYGEVIVHETAHQWWQSVVGNNEIEYGFLDEGLAEYSVVLFYERFSNYGYSREQLIESAQTTYKVFCSVQDKLFGKANTVMLRSLKDFTSEYEYVNVSYVKPCIMYDTLRKTIGDERFYKALKRYYQTYKFKNATPDDLVGAFEKTGADTNGFFESFFNGKVIL